MSETRPIDGGDPVMSPVLLLTPEREGEQGQPTSGGDGGDSLEVVELLVEEVSIDGMCGVY